MGGKNSTEKDASIFLNEYEELRRESDQRFGEVKIYKKITNPGIRVLAKEIWFENQTKYEDFLFKIKKRKNIFSENVASLLLVISKIKKQH